MAAGRHRRHVTVAERLRVLGVATGILPNPDDAPKPPRKPKRPERPRNYGAVL